MGQSGGELPGREKFSVFAEKRRDPCVWSWVSEERARRDEVERRQGPGPGPRGLVDLARTPGFISHGMGRH